MGLAETISEVLTVGKNELDDDIVKDETGSEIGTVLSLNGKFVAYVKVFNGSYHKPKSIGTFDSTEQALAAIKGYKG
jgi:hypothetical protein